MSGQWKPGDVVALNAGYCVRGGTHQIFDGKRWFCTCGDRKSQPSAQSRPLMVIDPDDREQVLRLLQCYYSGAPDGTYGKLLEQMQAALREFANPTPPKCLASVNVHLKTLRVAASCAEDKGHEGSHRSQNGTSWDASEVAP